MNDLDWNRVREAVERVIAKHEQRIRNEDLRERRAALRRAQKILCMAKATLLAGCAPWFLSPAMAPVISQIAATPSCIFRTDRPEVDPLRARALDRLRCWGGPKPQTVCPPSAASAARALKALGATGLTAATASRNLQSIWIETGGANG